MTDTPATFTPPEICWRSIGIWGDATCPKLPEEVHCHNCPVYIQSGRHQLEQTASDEYRRQWAEIIARPKESEPTDTISLAIFRLGNHVLALRTAVFKRILEPRPIHPIPHRNTNIVLGLVALQGELQLAFSLTQLLRLKTEPLTSGGRKRTLPRMALIEKQGERWVFPVDEMLGLHQLTSDAAMAVPSDENDPSTTYLTSMFELDERVVHRIDDELLFAGLKRSLQ